MLLRWSRTGGATALVALLAGCAVHPVPMSEAQQEARAKAELAKLFKTQDVLNGPLTLSDAIARAIKYNLDYRVKIMDQAVALGQTELANFDLLPKLTTSAGYTTRNNQAFGFGFGPDGKVSTNPSASQPRAHDTYDIGFAWNMLDFGLSYVQAKQLADQSLIAAEQRRKALHNLIRDVRNAWWRAESAQELLPKIDQLLDLIGRYAARAQLIEKRKMLPPLQIVAYRRSLLDLEQQLSLKRQELTLSQLELAELVNLRPGLPYRLTTVNDDDVTAPELAANIDNLESMALVYRPELREEAYKGRLTDLAWQKQLVSLLPTFGLNLDSNYDSNRYLLNSQWYTAGLNMSFGLLKAFSLPAARRANQTQKETDEVRSLALAATVMAQTRMAAVHYRLLRREFQVWQAAVIDDDHIVGYLTSARSVGLETELELVRAKARALLSRIQRDLVYASLQSAMAKIYDSVGLDLLPNEVASYDLPVLAKDLQQRMVAWEKKNFVVKVPGTLPPVTVAPVAGVPPKAERFFREAIQRILRQSRVPVMLEPGGKYQVEASVKLQPVETGGQPSILHMRIEDASGKVVVESEQKSMLVDPITVDQWVALGESAGFKVVEPLLGLLQRPHDSKDAIKAPGPAAPSGKVLPAAGGGAR